MEVYKINVTTVTMRSTKSTQDIFPDTISTTNNIEFHRSAAATTAPATTAAGTTAAAATLQTPPPSTLCDSKGPYRP